MVINDKYFQVTTDYLPSAFDGYDNSKDHDTYLVSAALGPDDGRHIFTYLNVLLTYIVPHDLAIGMQKAVASPVPQFAVVFPSHPVIPTIIQFFTFYQ